MTKGIKEIYRPHIHSLSSCECFLTATVQAQILFVKFSRPYGFTKYSKKEKFYKIGKRP